MTKGKTLCITVRINAFYNQFHRLWSYLHPRDNLGSAGGNLARIPQQVIGRWEELQYQHIHLSVYACDPGFHSRWCKSRALPNPVPLLTGPLTETKLREEY